MKAFLINAAQRTITEVEHNGDFRQIYEFLSTEKNKVSHFDTVMLNRVRDTLYVDDEGLLKPQVFFFRFVGPEVNPKFPPLAGNGLVLGTDDEGDSCDPQEVTLEWLQETVVFMDIWEVRHRAGLGEFD